METYPLSRMRVIWQNPQHYVFGGEGRDTLIGGGGNDVYIVNSSEDVVRETSEQSLDTVSSNVSYRISANVEKLVLTGSSTINATGNGGANSLAGNAAANALFGNAGNDTLVAGAGEDTLRGALRAGLGTGEIDSLTGGPQLDHFILGNQERHFYDDRVSGMIGRKDYAYIADFTPGIDELTLNGKASQYLLGASGISGLAGKGLFFKDESGAELIAVIRSGDATPLTADNTIEQARFV